MTKSFDERNAPKSRRVCEAMAAQAETGKRRLTERERAILDMWPRFEDGELVMPGDKVHYASAYNDETEIEVESITTMDGCFVLCDDGCRSNQYEHGQRVKRPVQSVLDADGVEIKVGDTVWHEDGSEQLVEELNRYGARCFDGDKRRTFNPKYLTHTRPDSWELLEEDASKDACMYFDTKYFNCGECPADGANCFGRMKSDLIRRMEVRFLCHPIRVEVWAVEPMTTVTTRRRIIKDFTGVRDYLAWLESEYDDGTIVFEEH